MTVAAATTRNALLKQAFAHIPTHGFSRTALALAPTTLPSSSPSGAAPEPLTETAINALFGPGEDARRTLVQEWLADARTRMREENAGRTVGLKQVLEVRLKMNEPVLRYLPEAFALLATPSTRFGPLTLPTPFLFPAVDPRPAFTHATSVAHEACSIANVKSNGTQWYVRRTTLAGAYAAAELHQLTSPATAAAFLEELLNSAFGTEKAVGEVALFGNYIARSWAGIIKSTGVF